MIRTLAAVIALALAAVAPASATVNTAANKNIVSGTGAQTQFAFTFIGVAAAYITVIYTDASGNETVLSQGSGATQYQISLNAPVQGAIWGVGGTVTYNPSGTPIASGTTLTIYRTLPLTQAITLQNQASIQVLGKGAEQGLDTGVMQGQQINEQISRAIVMNITNSAPPLPLPAAAQLANQGICGDSTGLNLIACSIPASGVISSAMQPVVNAASLAAGRLAFGLGSMSQENINGGTCGGATIQDDGSAGGANGTGYARVVYATVADATNQSVTCAFHGTVRIASGPLTYTLPRANTLFNGYFFRVFAVAGIETVTPNAADNFAGVASGTGIAIPPGSVCDITTTAASTGVWYLDCNGTNANLAAAASANALTLTLSGGAIPFRDPTLAGGDPKWALPAGGLAITIPSGATLGTSNNVAFRIWIFVTYNSGTPLLGVATCSNATNVFGCSSWELQQNTGTAITAGATSAGILYTSAGTSGDAVRIVGYAEYASGLATAGTWASGPTTLQVCLPPFSCNKPGQIIQTRTFVQTSVSSAYTNAFATSNLSVAIVPTSAANPILASASGNFSTASSHIGSQQLCRASASNLFGSISAGGGGSTSQTLFSIAVAGFDMPATTSSTTYFLCVKADVNATGETTATNSFIQVQEIMGALPEPANDNSLLTMVG